MSIAMASAWSAVMPALSTESASARNALIVVQINAVARPSSRWSATARHRAISRSRNSWRASWSPSSVRSRADPRRAVDDVDGERRAIEGKAVDPQVGDAGEIASTDQQAVAVR
jgi:hypothetical protein